MIRYDEAPISLGVDDGVVLVFQLMGDGGTVVLATFGIMHLPVSASASDSSNPPVTWTLTSDPGSWVETVKYPARAHVSLQIVWDDASTVTYNSPAFAGEPPFVLNKLLAVTG